MLMFGVCCLFYSLIKLNSIKGVNIKREHGKNCRSLSQVRQPRSNYYNFIVISSEILGVITRHVITLVPSSHDFSVFRSFVFLGLGELTLEQLYK